MKNWLFKIWSKIPDGIRKKPLDLQIALLLIMTACSGAEIYFFDPFSFLFVDFPLTKIIKFICSAYLFIGSCFLIYGLLMHHRHNTILSYCKYEMWAWRLIFSASGALFITEFFFGPVPGVSLGSVIWLLQFMVSSLKLFQYYNERFSEQKLWNN